MNDRDPPPTRRSSERIGPISKRVASGSRSVRSRRDDGRDGVLFGRLLALSDGVFAISLTLLVLSIEVPGGSAPLSDALLGLVPNLVAFAVTVFVVAIYWRNHHALFDSFSRLDGTLVGLNFVYLGLVALVPFPNALIGAYPGDPWSYVIFAGILAVLSAVDTAMLIYGRRRTLLRGDLPTATFELDVARGLLTAALFSASIPLSFFLVGWTPLVWVLLLVLDQFVARLGTLGLPVRIDGGIRNRRGN